MKTIPFNLEHAKAGRPVVASGYRIDVIAYWGKHVWCNRPEFTSSPLTYYAEELSHPADPAPGHNPAQLDEWTFETRKGGRALAPEEIYDRAPTHDIECWIGAEDGWDTVVAARGNSTDLTYRTFKPPGYFLPKVATRNLRPDELPESFLINEGTGTWVAHDRRNYSEMDIQRLVDNGCFWSRSLDGPWKPFTVEESK